MGNVLHRSINPARLFDINTFQSADEPTYVGQLGYPHEEASRCHLKRMHMTEKNGDLAVWRADRARFEAQLGDKYVAGMFTVDLLLKRIAQLTTTIFTTPWRV